MEMRPLEENTEHEKSGSLVVKPEERGVGGRPRCGWSVSLDQM